MREIVVLTILFMATGLLSSSCETSSPSHSNSASGTGAAQADASIRPYPLSTCLVTGEDLYSKGGPYTQTYKGQEVKFCCKPCQAAFRKNPELYLAKLR